MKSDTNITIVVGKRDLSPRLRFELTDFPITASFCQSLFIFSKPDSISGFDLLHTFVSDD